MNNLIMDSSFFGVAITIGAYLIGLQIKKKWDYAILNPLFLAAIMVIVVLLFFHIDYSVYENGSKYLSIFLTPVTVCLAVPLYRQIEVLKKNHVAVAVGIVTGCICHTVLMALMVIVVHYDKNLILSLMSKSVTTAIAIGITDEIGGQAAITIVGVTVVGISGAMFAPVLLKLFHIDEPVAQGLAIGAASHALGTTKAMEIGEIQGAMSSLAIVVNGLLTTVAVPIAVSFF